MWAVFVDCLFIFIYDKYFSFIIKCGNEAIWFLLSFAIKSLKVCGCANIFLRNKPRSLTTNLERIDALDHSAMDSLRFWMFGFWISLYIFLSGWAASYLCKWKVMEIVWKREKMAILNGCSLNYDPFTWTKNLSFFALNWKQFLVCQR